MSGVSRAAIVAEARRWLGTPYQHQASVIGVGADCLGLLRGVWRALIGPEPEKAPPYTPDWAEARGSDDLMEAARKWLREIPISEARAGDVLLFRWKPYLPAKHAAIATGTTSMIHAQDGAVVSEVALSNWWLRRLAFVFRFPETD